MEKSTTSAQNTRISVPVIALSLYSVASGYLMSLIPLMLPHYGLDSGLASWLASIFYTGLLAGAIGIEPIVSRLGHRNAFVLCLVVLMATVIIMPALNYTSVWLFARFTAGVSVAGVFVIVESWLLHGDESNRAKRLGLYMGALYGGSSIGQLGIGTIGVTGGVPFIAILTLMLIAILVLIFGESDQPKSEESARLSFKQIAKLNHAAIIGCIISGLTLGAIYGLMPLELKQRGINNSDIGGLMALIILGGMAVQPMVPLFSKFLGRTLMMAMFCLLGVAAVSITVLLNDMGIFAVSLFILGMAIFALYPVAINLGCDGLDASYIVSATQVMLFSYSIGSVSGPIIANKFMSSQNGLMDYLFASLLATCIYMLFASVKGKRQIMAGE
ncbi:MFS transporter [Vibrio lamellibrachiae]|uniref:MFS transporter n=1 Tax=Vibrio lamellibrachiae TaxID=2910253 RepID=UPI003D135A2A